MKFIVTAAAIAAALGGSAAASASSFDFSYTFSDGQVLSGSLDGTSTNGGQSVTNISDVQVELNGIAFAGGAGPLQLNAWNTSTESFDDTTPVVLHVNGSLNNFSISDVDTAVNTSPDYEFSFLNDPAIPGGSAVTAANFMASDAFSGPGATQLASDEPAGGTWTLTPAPVPLPAALPLLASGLGLFGFARRRAAR